MSSEGRVKIDFHMSSDEQRSRYRYDACLRNPKPQQQQQQEQQQQQQQQWQQPQERNFMSRELQPTDRRQHTLGIMSRVESPPRLMERQSKQTVAARNAASSSMSPLARPSLDSQPSTTNSAVVAESLLMRLFEEGNFSKLNGHLTRRGVYSSILGNKTVGDLAAERGDCKLLTLLHESQSYDFNRRNKDGMVPFHYAFKKRQTEAMRLLKDYQASPDVPFPSLSGKGYSDTPLHVACSMADTKAIDALLDDCDASLSVVDSQGNTPLHRACLEDSFLVVKTLQPRITENVLNMPGVEGKTALHIAVLNQNREIVRLLLTTPGALVDIPADNDKTVIDIVLELNNHMMLNDFIYYYTVIKMSGVHAKSFKELSSNPQFGQYLEFLSDVDNEFRGCIIELKEISDTEEQLLCTKLQDDDRIDLIEFTEVILELLQTEKIHELINGTQNEDVLVKIVENIVHYVLFREDATLLQRIMDCGVLWTKTSAMIEMHIDSLYLQAPEREVNGIVKNFRSRFVQNKKVDHDKLSKYYGNLLSCYRLKEHSEDVSPNSPYMRNPMKTLPVWSVLSGRLGLTEYLLEQEKFDVVPLALFCAALLRTFPDNHEIVVEDEAVEDLAQTCEKFARKVVEKVNSIDTSYGRSVSLDYLLRPLESYGGVSCIRLAASNNCALFLQSELCQRALDKMWFRSLLHVNPIQREIVIWLGAIPFNLMVPMLLLYFDSKESSARNKHEERPFISDDQSTQRSVKFQLMLDTQKLSSGAVEDSSDQQDRVVPSVNFQQFGTYLPHRRPTNDQSGAEIPLVNLGKDKEDCTSLSTLEHDDGNYMCHCAKLLYDFYRTPGVKFRYHVASHILLLILMSYFLLLEFKYELGIAEFIVYSILGGLLLEEAGEIIQYLIHHDIQSYFKSKWNIIDLSALISGATGFGIRWVETKHGSEWSGMMRDFEDSAWYSARVFLSICCTLYWIRLLYISNVLENLGPKLKMIAEMIIKDLLPFLLILFTFILGFGVLMHSLLYPNGFRAWNFSQISSTHVLLGMLKICFYSMVGEYSLDTITGDESCENVYQNLTLNEGNCPHKIGRYLVPYLILPLYVIVTEILLLNLIIAMFSKTIETIDSRSKDLWQFERHDLILEFETRSSLPPPLNIFDLVHKVALLLRKFCHNTCSAFCRRVDQAEQEAGFSRRVILQYLLFQALSLRKNRLQLMQQCLPKQETDTERMLMKMRKIVQSELVKLKLAENFEAFGDGTASEASGEQPSSNTPLGSSPHRGRSPGLSRTNWPDALRLRTMWR